MSPDYGLASGTPGGPRGYVDFHVDGSFNFGVELTRDGKQLQAHAARFELGGIYAPLRLASWVLVDFRQQRPRPETVAASPGCLFVVLSADFSKATLLQHDTDDVVVVLKL